MAANNNQEQLLRELLALANALGDYCAGQQAGSLPPALFMLGGWALELGGAPAAPAPLEGAALAQLESALTAAGAAPLGEQYRLYPE
jgi:hypothetical protein